MDKKQYYKVLFLFGALYNWIVGITFLVISIFMSFLFPFFFNFELTSPVFLELFAISVIIMGMGNYWFSKDINKNQDAVRMCCISRIIVFILITYYWLIGDLSIYVFLLVIPNLIIGILYIEFFVHSKGM
ncbi:MAG: hypothetical protein EU539_04740 [Promethearchaeota archaeon]|nr:MAG: hypothetical protein EU539_04740 [Candidatus Lokiarchaeota archaeon]